MLIQHGSNHQRVELFQMQRLSTDGLYLMQGRPPYLFGDILLVLGESASQFQSQYYRNFPCLNMKLIWSSWYLLGWQVEYQQNSIKLVRKHSRFFVKNIDFSEILLYNFATHTLALTIWRLMSFGSSFFKSMLAWALVLEMVFYSVLQMISCLL